MIAVLLASLLPQPMLVDTVDVIELTHIYDTNSGALQGDYYLYWEFRDGGYRIVDWRSAIKLPRPDKCVHEFWDFKSKCARRIEGRIFIERHLWFDAECENRKEWPDARRRKLRSK